MFLSIFARLQALTQVENQLIRSLWTVHTKFKEVLCCLCKFSRDNTSNLEILLFSREHAKVKEDRLWPHFNGAIGAIDGSHVPCSVSVEEVVYHTCQHGYLSHNVG
jgi:hypothetical protein